MDSIIIYPESKKQLDVVKQFLNLIEIPFEKVKNKRTNPSPSGDKWFDDPRNLKKVEKGIRALESGEKGTVLTKELQKQLLGL